MFNFTSLLQDLLYIYTKTVSNPDFKQGIVHFLTHRSLWSPLLQQLLPIIGLSAGVTATMFLFTYVPQVAVLVFVSGPFAAISAAVLVLSESATITTALSKAWFIGEALIDTFDAVSVPTPFPFASVCLYR